MVGLVIPNEMTGTRPIYDHSTEVYFVGCLFRYLLSFSGISSQYEGIIENMCKYNPDDQLSFHSAISFFTWYISNLIECPFIKQAPMAPLCLIFALLLFLQSYSQIGYNTDLDCLLSIQELRLPSQQLHPK